MLKCHSCRQRVTPVVSLRPCLRHLARAPRAVLDDEEVDDRVAAFLKEQDASERGTEAKTELKEVVGDDEVDEERAKAYCRDITRVVRKLKEKRDMDYREAKLIVQIDDPRNDEARKMGIEDSAGVSRDEMAAALDEVMAGVVPKDRIALRMLHTEMTEWPFIDSDEKSAKFTALEVTPAEDENEGSISPGWRPNQAVPPVGRDPNEKPKGLADMLPEWVGYSGLYAVTLIPFFILVATVTLLFVTSLK